MNEPVRASLVSVLKHLGLAGLGLLAACSSTGRAPDGPAYGASGRAQLFEGMGPYRREVTTSSPEAGRYFEQGLNWMYAFNHDEAVRSFTRAAELDPGCAMAWWGASYAQGPNYNDPGMSPARCAAAWEALQKALAALDEETAVERALMEALTRRYASDPPEDRAPLDQAFADAMASVWSRFPDDPDVGTLYAESMMVQHPWELYASDGAPARDDTLVIVDVLERVLSLDPLHPGANHLYIHAVEPSRDKERGIAAADRLADLVPASGHLRHMPSHIYVQVGMWERSIEQNTKAEEQDRRFRRLSPEQGIQNGYMVHNSHMLAFSAMMVGREREATAAARAMWDDLPEQALRDYGPFFDPVMGSIYDVEKRFGRWDAILAEPRPPEFLPATTALWRAHRAIAFAAKKDFANAEREQALFRKAKQALPPEPAWEEYEKARQFLDVSDLFIAGEIALQRERWDDAVRLLEKAAALEDALGYDEPPMYLQPVRHTLGAVYLTCGRPADAERVYRADLDVWPRNGWSLYGLMRALEQQGRTDEASAVRAQYQSVWAGADEPTQTSCKCIPQT
jgi:tetratricopeptide (TPR) repeat protein